MCDLMASSSKASTSKINPPRKLFRKKPKRPILWGGYTALVAAEKDDDEDTKPIIEGILKKSLRKDPRQYKKQDVTHNLTLTDDLIRSSMDSKVLHHLQLDHFHYTVSKMMEEVTNSASDNAKSYPTLPAIPLNPNLEPKKEFGFLSQDGRLEETDFSVGLSKPKIDISLNIAKQLLYKSVGTLLCHAGFIESEKCPLDVMTDVVDQLLHTICGRLRVAVDHEVMTGESGFHDPIERVFTEMNLGSIDELLFSYQTSVVEPNLKMIEKCDSLSQSYLALVKSKVDGMQETDLDEDSYIGSVDKGEEMEDEEDDDEDVPEIHFPALDEEDQIGLQPSLEPGFQMLDSLEHDETLQNLDPDEEINVSDSPSQEFMLSVISQLASSVDTIKTKKRKPRK